jgi:SEC-C motif domain protein
MRSRYVAYALCHSVYLLTTWHSTTRPKELDISEENNPKWMRLNIKKHSVDGEDARVEFIATYKINGRAHRLHENSRFIKENGCWYYVDGDIY